MAVRRLPHMKLLLLMLMINVGAVIIILPLLTTKPARSVSCHDSRNYHSQVDDSGVDSQLPLDITSPTIAHCILTDEFQMAHYLTIRTIMRHVQPSFLYIHVSNISGSIPKEFLTALNQDYKMIEMVSYTPPNKSFSGIGAIREQVKVGIYFEFGLLLQSGIRSLLQDNKCLVDDRLRVVVLHEDCPYYQRSDVPATSMRALVSEDPTDERAPAIALLKSLYPKLDPHVPTPLLVTSNIGPWHKPVWQAYCDCDQFELRPHPHPVIPRIVHYTWFTGVASTWNMTFMQTISALSNLKINKVDKLIIHSNVPPTGPHWEWLQQRYGSRVMRVFHPAPNYIHGRRINPAWRAHQSDVVRPMVLRRYGGMYFDWDCIALKSHEEFRYYDAIMGHGISPLALSNGHVMFSSSSEFLKIYSDNYINYNSNSWGETSVIAPKKLYLQRPYLIKVVDRFKDFRIDKSMEAMYNGKDEYDATVHYAFHYTSPEPEDVHPFELNFATAATLNSTFGSLLRHVINSPE